MYLLKDASKRRIAEAQNARNNRAEIVKALSHGEITRRDLVKWGIYGAGGMLLAKNGLSPYAKSAYANVPTGTPLSPMFGALPYSQEMPRLTTQEPVGMNQANWVDGRPMCQWTGKWASQAPAKWDSYHSDFDMVNGAGWKNPVTGRGPMEGRPPGTWFAHQRWQEYLPTEGYVMSIGSIADNTRFHPNMPAQRPNSVWAFGQGAHARGTLPPPLIKGRYGVPILNRIYNALPVDRTDNEGFGRNEASTHFHNAHIGAESDGASNAYHFPGTFYDYHWGTTLARADMINTDAHDKRASGPDGNGGLIQVPGDFRELQGTMWFHDHRFFFTAENVYKGMAGMFNMYSGPDRGHEELDDGVNLRLPSGKLLDYGNVDFDVNLMVSDYATDPDGQYFFDIFDSDGFLGDNLLVNFAHKPFMKVLPRKYRFRLLNASMSRFIQLGFLNASGGRVPFRFIANDGNLVVNPLTLNLLDQQGSAERYDIIVDFSQFSLGDKVWLANFLEQDDGRRPRDTVTNSQAMLGGTDKDPAVGRFMEFQIVDQVDSVDVPGIVHRATDQDKSQVPMILTEQIPIVAPVRERVVEWKRGAADNPADCFPECGDKKDLFEFAWGVRVNGQETHSMNANRVSVLIPRPGETEHWTYINGGGGWDHPIHLHFEEGLTINRGTDPVPATERLARKDVWRLHRGGQVRFQVTFGEYGGAYVNHCHNTVHEDFAMLMRYQLLTDPNNPKNAQWHASVSPTPVPTADGCTYITPEILQEGVPAGFPVTIGTVPASAGTPTPPVPEPPAPPAPPPTGRTRNRNRRRRLRR